MVDGGLALASWWVTNKDDVDDEERRETEVAVRNDRVQGVKGY
jgi:hypothetical protein